MALQAKVTITNNIPQVMNTIKKVELQRVAQATSVVKGKTISLLSGTRHGRRYKVPGTKNAFYIASAPGEPPARATGELVNDVTETIKSKKDEVQGIVGNTSNTGDKSIWLEKGRRHQAPRPYLQPAFNLTKGIVKVIFSGKWL